MRERKKEIEGKRRSMTGEKKSVCKRKRELSESE
jgi:hypothetical protein